MDDHHRVGLRDRRPLSKRSQRKSSGRGRSRDPPDGVPFGKYGDGGTRQPTLANTDTARHKDPRVITRAFDNRPDAPQFLIPANKWPDTVHGAILATALVGGGKSSIPDGSWRDGSPAFTPKR
jgi:hypothetical protein